MQLGVFKGCTENNYYEWIKIDREQYYDKIKVDSQNFFSDEPTIFPKEMSHLDPKITRRCIKLDVERLKGEIEGQLVEKQDEILEIVTSIIKSWIFKNLKIKADYYSGMAIIALKLVVERYRCSIQQDIVDIVEDSEEKKLFEFMTLKSIKYIESDCFQLFQILMNNIGLNCFIKKSRTKEIHDKNLEYFSKIDEKLFLKIENFASGVFFSQLQYALYYLSNVVLQW